MLILFIFSLFPFFGCKEKKERKLSLTEDEYSKMTFKCRDKTIPLSPENKTYIIQKINFSNQIELEKGSGRQNLIIYLDNSDMITIFLDDDKLKWNKSEVWTHELNIDDDYFEELCQKYKNEESENLKKL